jgi:hypothetical protein
MTNTLPTLVACRVGQWLTSVGLKVMHLIEVIYKFETSPRESYNGNWYKVMINGNCRHPPSSQSST